MKRTEPGISGEGMRCNGCWVGGRDSGSGSSSFEGSEGEGVAGAWMSILQPLLIPSTSKPSRRTRILPQESQLGGTRTLSRSMTLCFRVWRFRSEWMPREEWIRVGSELGTEREV